MFNSSSSIQLNKIHLAALVTIPNVLLFEAVNADWFCPRRDEGSRADGEVTVDAPEALIVPEGSFKLVYRLSFNQKFNSINESTTFIYHLLVNNSKMQGAVFCLFFCVSFGFLKLKFTNILHFNKECSIEK